MTITAQNNPSSADVDLAALIHPISRQDFFREYYGKRPALCSGRPNNAPPLFTLDDLTARLQCLKLDFGEAFSLARDGEWLSPIFQRSLAKSANWVSTVLEKDWTVRVKAIHQDFFPVHCLAGRLSDSLKSPVNINVYYSPAGAQGFGFHRDPVDVFAWQQSGRKKWKVLAPLDDNVDNPVIDTVLEPGQVLYIPANCLHAAVADDDDDSLHLTIGFASTFSQAKRQLHDQLEDWMNSASTEGLDGLAFPDQMSDEQTCLSNDEILLALDVFRERLCREIEGVDPQKNFETFTRQIQPGNIVRQLTELDDAGTFTLLESVRSEPQEGHGVAFRAQSRNLVFKEELREALDVLSGLRTFHPADLPLERSTALALCRLLVGWGVLEPAREA